MRFSCILLVGITFLFATLVHAQDASNPAVEQSRLFPRTVPPTGGNITPDGITLPAGETTTSSDESFGAQQILKTEEKIPEFTLSGATSLFFTSNVALTHKDDVSDGFWVGEAAANWTPRINPQLQF